ncbi:MAG TPA: glycoside hydrolase family 3 C-terminal domain-containing protein [Steroidobacteraceae bacterium]|nr:glycoside hydrolase family 3 C-terminal domain-containing protein [Steroidobacteraceae bacterium]
MIDIELPLIHSDKCLCRDRACAEPQRWLHLIGWLALQVGLLLATAAHASGPSGPGPCPGPMPPDGPTPTNMPWKDATLSPDARAKLLVAAMTLNEKIDLVTGTPCSLYGYYKRAIPRLGIPALTMADGPGGVRVNNQATNGGRATEFSAPIALAASWDLSLARGYADLAASEAFATGHNVLMGPEVDIDRTPLAGRAFEAYGEDPYLTSQMAVPFIHAIQLHPVMSVVKHYHVYNQETKRFAVDAQIDERTLREIYTVPFEAAALEGPGGVMCSFNSVNGSFMCENAPLLSLLKKQLGFAGFVMSDYGATHSTVPSALAGLDMEQPSENYYGQKLKDAISAGQVPLSGLDDKVTRIVTPMFQFGLFDRPVNISSFAEQEHGAESRSIAEQGVVLLKNAGGLLPLPTGLKSIAVIGADANNASAEGGGSAEVKPTYTVSPLQGIQQRAGTGVRVQYLPGTDPVNAAHTLIGEAGVPSSVLTPIVPAGAAQPAQSMAHGLYAQYWLNSSFQGTPDVTRVDPQVAVMMGFANFPGFSASSLPGLPTTFNTARFSARWTATLVAPATGDYTLTLTSLGQAWVYIDDKLAIDHGSVHDVASLSTTLHLAAGEQHALRIDYIAMIPSGLTGAAARITGGKIILTWTPPENAVPPAVQAAADLAKASDVAVVVVRDYETETYDRPSMALPNGQDELIQQVAAANPRTILVNMTGQPITMPWLGSVPAVLQAWYAGQEQGNVIARILFGDVNPSGKLPITFPQNQEQTPTDNRQDQYPGLNDEVSYSENVYVGYRWYDANGLEPLFPFGYGLSYTTFQYGKLQVQNQPAAVSFNLTNSGPRTGAEAVQVYVGPLAGNAATPPKQLAGFTKVRLEPGATTRVTVALNPKALAHWDVATHAWMVSAGQVAVYVGSSSRDLRLSGTITATAQTLGNATH